MKTHLDKKQDISQRTSDTQLQRNNSQPTFQFVDNRPEAIAQRQLQEGMKNSPQNQEQQAIQKMADNHAAQQFTIQKKENNTGLPDNLKSGIENLSGYSMDDVKVHYNSEKPAQLQAHAFAQGTDIHLGAGQEKHLPHEAWHVVQQKQGRVKPTMQMKGGVNVNDDKGLEREADVMAGRAFQFKIINDLQNNKLNSFSQEVFQYQVVQRISEEDANQMELRIRNSATGHGYSRDMLEPIVKHRYSEIIPGNGNIMLLGKGVDENNPRYGRLVYDCFLMKDGTYYVDVFHAHGGQTEYPSPRGY
ncbi:MAG: DUF4157 domain-containing protein [Chitinophagales bacterium]